MRKAFSYIRMSTDIQLKGDSLRRQLERSEAYAKEHDLELVDSIGDVPLKDLGISAFKGQNAQTGALAIFMAALDRGDVESDSVLLVESLDRISRERVSSAFPQFMNMVNKGVEIVTLSDGQRYNKKRIDEEPLSLLLSLLVMVRANEESETKSRRIKAAWSNKRKTSKDKILTKLCPGWLQYSQESRHFEVIPGRDKVVKQIFDMCINTGGLYAIAGYLNQEGVPTFRGGKIWYRPYIQKILTNRAVLGETQHHEIIDGKRQKSGEPVLDYFPRLIDEHQFLLAQAAIARRTVAGRGRKGRTFGNLFMGMAYCGNCKSRMSLRNHGGDQKYSKCLLCIRKKHKAGCTNGEWNTNDLERLLIPHLREVNFADLVDESREKRGISSADQLDILNGSLTYKEREMDVMIAAVTSLGLNPDVRARFSVKINALQADISQTKRDIEVLKKEISDERYLKDENTQDKLKELLEKIHTKKDDYLFRSSINQLLIRVIERIELLEPVETFSSWEFDEENSDIQKFRKTSVVKSKSLLSELVTSSEFAQFYRRQRRQIRVVYKSGSVRHILWGDDVSFGPVLRRPM